MNDDELPPWICPDGREYGTRYPEDRIIVGAGIGRIYRDRLRSTIHHCAVHCPETWRLWYECLPEGCPTHQEMPYAFKIYALRRVIEEAGFRYVLWMDASFQPIASIEPVWQHIKEHGWYIPPQGDSKLGQWTSDAALEIFGISRDEAMEIPMVFSGLVGLDMKSINGKAIWDGWKHYYERGAFAGPHYNRPGEFMYPLGHKWAGHCSNDPRCEGHRHDESALAFALHKLGLKPEKTGFLTLENEKSAVIGHMVPDYDVVKMRQYIEGHGVLGWQEAMDACR